MAKSQRQQFCLPKSLRHNTRFPRPQLKIRWLALYLTVVASLQAQQPPPPVSPEVHPDGRVTFRIRAPKASTVEVGGDWKPGHFETMAKDADGVWSATLGPLEPSIYIYWFTVDGLAIADPVNRAPESAFGQRGGSPLQARPLRPVTNCNCICPRGWSGEQQEVNDQSAG